MNPKQPRYPLPEAAPRVKALAFSYGLDITYLLPQARGFATETFAVHLPTDKSKIDEMAARTALVLLEDERDPEKGPYTNDADQFHTVYVPAFAEGYHFGLYAIAHGWYRLLARLPKNERHAVAFLFAWELFVEELEPEQKAKEEAWIHVDAELKRMYQEYTAHKEQQAEPA